MGDVYMVNGKILSGLPNHAKDIEFDNDGTTLNSTNTEDAIKEVNSNLLEIKDITSSTIPTGSNDTVDYPAGYDQTNCILVGAYYTSGSGAHVTGTNYEVYLTSGTQIQIFNNTGAGRAFHVQLMKLPS